MSEPPDPVRQVFVRSAWQRLLASFVAVLGGFGIYGGMGIPSSPVFMAALHVGALLLAPRWLVVWSFVPLGEFLRASGPLSEVEVYACWGRVAVGDAFGLVPLAAYSLLLLDVGPAEHAHLFGSLSSCVALGAFAVIHLLSLPNAIQRCQCAGSVAAPLPPSPQPADPVRMAFRRLAEARMISVLIGLASFILPWSHADVLHTSFPGGAAAPASPAPDATVSALGLLLDRVGSPRSQFVGLGAGGLLLLIVLASWEVRRSRWLVTIDWNHTRVFAAWGLILLAAGLPMLMWLGMLLAIRVERGHLLLGGWVCCAALVATALCLLAFTPLMLMRALQRRAEANRQAELAQRDAVQGS